MSSRFGMHFVSSFLLSLMASCSIAFGQTSYYVSSSGSDSSSGTSSSTPWRTASKVNSVSFSPGDQILFRRGDEFFGQIRIDQSGSAASPITIGSYGTSAHKPILTGAVHLSGWTVYKGSIYAAQAPSLVKNLFCDGVQMTLARYPNSGFLEIKTSNGTTISSTSTLTAISGITQPSEYWNRANIRVRTADYAFETRIVSSYNGTMITLVSPTFLPMKPGWGFYLDNKLEELDAPGEWYCDPSTNTVYFYPPNGTTPNELSIEAGVLDFGILSAQTNITISGLEFRYQSQAAVRFLGTPSNIRVLSNDISGELVNGIQFNGSSADCIIDDNTIRDVNGRGIYLERTYRTTISNNLLRNIGLVQGYGVTSTNGMTGIFLQAGSNNIIRRNSIDSVGYVGIRLDGSYNLAENNVLSNLMLRLSDGGALYCYSETPSITFGTTLRNNVIENVVGNHAGAPTPSWETARGIYLDYGSYNMLVEGNTVVRTRGAGLFIQYTSYCHTIRGNAFYDCGKNTDDCFLRIVQDPAKTYGQNVITKNVFYPLDSTQTLVMIQEKNATVHIPGTFDSNYYCNPYNNLPIRTLTYTSQWVTKDLSLDQWRTYSSQDQHSKGLFTKPNPFIVTDSSAASLIPDGRFQSGTAGWADWNTNTLVQYTSNGGLDGGCLMFQLENGSSASRAAASPQVGLTKGQCYQLRFSLRAPHKGLLTMAVRQNHSPYSTLTAPRIYPMGPERTDFEGYLATNTTDPQTRIEFRVSYPDSIFFLDNVLFRPVKGSYVLPDEQSPLFVNKSAQQTTFDLGSESFHDFDGNLVTGSLTLAPYSSKILIRSELPADNKTDVKLEPEGKPKEFMLYQNYPNPFNPSTVIRYALPTSAKIRLEMFDSLGQLIAVLVDSAQQAGFHETTFDAHDLANGVYFCRLSTPGFSNTKKLLLIK